MTDEVRIDQVLHGYRDGHRLLAASRRIDGRESAAMARLSDLSGSFSRAFPPSYLTGYPAPSVLYYALARTWLAEEMPRPGCVWTHTLLVPFADLATISDLSLLLDLFERPTLDALDRYREPVRVGPVALEASPKPCLDRRALGVIHRLYFEDPDLPVKLPASPTEPGQDEALALALWSQQWPRLQRRFRFCTYAAAERIDESGPFDLQFTPEAETVRQPPSEVPGAASFAMEDIAQPGRYRAFLRRYGADVDGTRKNFVALATICKALEPPVSATRFRVALHTAAFDVTASEPQTTILLELGKLPEEGDVAAGVSPNDWLAGVLSSGDSIAHVVSEKDLSRALAEAWPMVKDNVTEFVSSPDAGEMAHKVLVCAAGLIQPSAAGAIVAQRPSAGLPLLREAPQLAHSPAFWKRTGPAASALIDGIPWKHDKGALVRAVMEGAPDEVSRLLRRPDGEHFQKAFLRLVSREPQRRVPGADQVLLQSERVWLRAAAKEPKLFIALLTVASRTAISGEFISSHPDEWLARASALSRTNFNRLSSLGQALLLALACRSCSPAACEVLIRTFETAHGLEQGPAPSDGWKLVESVMKPDWSLFEPDRCRRLRLTVASRWITCNFEEGRFLELTRKTELFRRLCRDAASLYGGAGFLRRAGRQAKAARCGWSVRAKSIIDEVTRPAWPQFWF